MQQKNLVLFFSSIIPNYDENTFVSLWKVASENHIKDFLTQKITFKEQRIRRSRDIFQNQNLTEKESFEYFNKYLGFYEDSWTIYPDVIEVLDFLKQQNIDVGILSDGAQKQQEFKIRKNRYPGIFQICSHCRIRRNVKTKSFVLFERRFNVWCRNL